MDMSVHPLCVSVDCRCLIMWSAVASKASCSSATAPEEFFMTLSPVLCNLCCMLCCVYCQNAAHGKVKVKVNMDLYSALS